MPISLLRRFIHTLTANILKKYIPSTIRERESPKSAPEKPFQSRRKFHIALHQKYTALEDRLCDSLYPDKVIFHYFENFGQLYENFRQSQLDLIVIASNINLESLLELADNIKAHPTIQLIPLILYTSIPEKHVIIEAFGKGVDDFLSGFWDDEIIGAKLRMLCYRSKRDIGANPSSNLPGAAAIEADADRRIARQEPFAVCYADLDNFKAYNDYYGYVYGDKIIRLTGMIIRDTVLDLAPDGFIGHIGGDDFVFNVAEEKVEEICKKVIETFDKMIIAGYAEKDLKRGYIEVPNRKGDLERYSMLTISIAVFPYTRVKFEKIGEISHMMADLKKYTKTFNGSNFRVERRKKY
ncbi:MAG: diguanylate cyclase [candidate division Zixibacteria bacterium]|nr:diguanylate cyclase [candidate division Zixibacteria bacterium]